MLDKILAWLKSKNITSHSVAVVVTAAAALMVTDQQFRDFFVQLFQNHPKIVSVAFSLAGIIFKYSHSSTPTDPPAQP